MPSLVHAEDVRGTAEACFDAITDFASYPSWQSAVKSVEVRSRHADGLAHEVGFVIDLKLREVHYALYYEYDRPGEIRWTYAGGDIAGVTGGYVFADAGDGVVCAEYRLDIDLGFPVPALVRNRLQRDVMRRSVRELKQRVERDPARS